MIKRILSLENKFSIAKASLIIGALTLASRLVGLYRDRLFASRFGAGDILDVYYAAFRIPDFVFNLLILGTLSAALIPVFGEYLIKNKKKANEIASTVLNVSTLGMLVLCFVLFLLASPLTKILVPGFPDGKFLDTLALTKILLISPVIFTISNVLSSVLNSQKRFFVVALAPILYNLGIIAGLLFFYPRLGLPGLAWGVIFGASLHVLVQLPEALRFGFRWQAVLNFRDQAMLKIARLFVPRIFGLDTSQISLIIGSVIGSILASGSIAVLNLANNLQAVPIGVFALAAAVASFPSLSEAYVKNDGHGYMRLLYRSMRQILFFIIPITILMLLYRAFIVRLAFGAGKFSWQDTILTFNTLGIFTFTLFSQSLTPLFSRAFYARQNTKTPVIIGLISMALNVLASYWLSLSLGVVGIAAGFSLASIFNCAVLFGFLRRSLYKDYPFAKTLVFELDSQFFRSLAKIILASLLMGTAAYSLIYALSPLFNTQTTLGILLQSGISGLVAVAVFGFCGLILKIEELQSAKSLLKKLFSR